MLGDQNVAVVYHRIRSERANRDIPLRQLGYGYAFTFYCRKFQQSTPNLFHALAASRPLTPARLGLVSRNLHLGLNSPSICWRSLALRLLAASVVHSVMRLQNEILFRGGVYLPHFMYLDGAAPKSEDSRVARPRVFR
jgi:hypothetical protein